MAFSSPLITKVGETPIDTANIENISINSSAEHSSDSSAL